MALRPTVQPLRGRPAAELQRWAERKLVAKSYPLLLSLCERVYVAQRKAEQEAKRRLYGDGSTFECLVLRKDKIRVELPKEDVGHHEPHIHITHSDKIDVSVCLRDFRIFAGTIERNTLKYLLRDLRPKRKELLAI